MAQIIKRAIQNNAVDGEKLRLNNNQALRARNAANNADIDVLKVNTSNEIEFLDLPVYDGENLATEAFVTGITGGLIPSSEKGAPNGVATLDGAGRIPTSQLTLDAIEYKGTWDADENDPELQDGIGTRGDLYRVEVAGTVDFGSGNITFRVGDKVVYNGTVWEKWETSEFDRTTDDVPEGSNNLYFTDARARSAAVVNSMAGNETDQAPSVDSVKGFISANATRAEVETFTLTSTDITNGYVDLGEEASTVLEVTPKGFPPQHPEDDYTLSVVSSVTRVTFTGDMLLLEAGDKLKITYSV